MGWALIPQVFYDLIARIVPGSITLLAAYCVLVGPAKAVHSTLNVVPEESGMRFSSLLIWLLLSYFVGRILAEVWEYKILSRIRKLMRKKASNSSADLKQEKEGKEHYEPGDEGKHKSGLRSKAKGKFFWKECLDEYDKLADLLGEPKIGTLLSKKTRPATYVLHDHLRIYAPSQAVRILKLHAEERMLKSLVVGLSVVFVINIPYCVSQTGLSWDRVFLVVGLLISVVFCWLGARRSRNYYNIATHRAWLLHNFPLGAAKRSMSRKPPRKRTENDSEGLSGTHE